jgi:hypothetical protein
VILDWSLICGVDLGVEYVEASEEADIEFPCLIISLFIVRLIIEFID